MERLLYCLSVSIRDHMEPMPCFYTYDFGDAVKKAQQFAAALYGENVIEKRGEHWFTITGADRLPGRWVAASVTRVLIGDTENFKSWLAVAAS